MSSSWLLIFVTLITSTGAVGVFLDRLSSDAPEFAGSAAGGGPARAPGYRNAWDDCGGVGASATERMRTIAAGIKGWADLEAVSKIAHDHGALHVSDATFATPVILKPLDHGCDMVIQSLTKYYEGHNIMTGGSVISKTPELAARVKHIQNIHGNIINPFAAFIIAQTTKTMPLRVKKQSESAQMIAEFLESHPKVTKVMYPGLKSFPQKELADRYHKNGIHGGMLWFDIVGGSPAGTALMNNIHRPWSLCENLGATESIITACAVMTHANMLKEDREKVGITDGFIRVSVGIEDPADLIKSLSLALEKC